MSIFDLLAKDPSISADYCRQFDRVVPESIVHPQSNLLVRRAHVQADRRFTGEPQTGFGVLDGDVYGPMNEDDDIQPPEYRSFDERARDAAEFDRELADDCRGIDS